MVQPPVDVEFSKVDAKEFCEAIPNSVNAIGHAGTIALINSLCNTNIPVNRVNIKAKIGDTVYIVILSTRLEEGKVLNSEEVKQMHDEGKVVFLKATIYNYVLSGLAECEGRCDEVTYDQLAHMAKKGE